MSDLFRALVFILVASSTGCSTLRSSWIRDDYPASDRTETLRLGVLTDPAHVSPEICELMSLVARRYVNQKRDFIVKENACGAKPSSCRDGLEGLLLLRPSSTLHHEGEDEAKLKVELSLDAELIRCRDGQAIWRAEGQGQWGSQDKNVSELVATYVGELGEAVRPFVPASFHLLRAVLDSLPTPVLMGEEAIMEKIELGE